MLNIGSLIGAAGSLLGGIFGDKKAEDQAKRQLAADRRNRALQAQINARNYRRSRAAEKRARTYAVRDSALAWDRSQYAAKQAYERDLYAAKNRIQWLAADAKAAGIHPLAAMGVSSGFTTSPAVVPQTSSTGGNVSLDTPYFGGVSRTGSALGDGIISASQALGDAFSTRSRLENELLKAQIEQTRAGTVSMLGAATSRSILNPNAFRPPPVPPGISPQAGMVFGDVQWLNPDGTLPAENAEFWGSDPMGWLQGLWNISQLVPRSRSSGTGYGKFEYNPVKPIARYIRSRL